ncbi:MAG: hypothetical protein PHE83_18620 [Opitutaceae bacterium]|nr:hypothetical protein [Opitutaceae bacterium]
MTKEAWIEAVYQELNRRFGAPANETETRNMREWASAMADGDDSLYADGFSPADAVQEEIWAAS